MEANFKTGWYREELSISRVLLRYLLTSSAIYAIILLLVRKAWRYFILLIAPAAIDSFHFIVLILPFIV